MITHPKWSLSNSYLLQKVHHSFLVPGNIRQLSSSILGGRFKQPSLQKMQENVALKRSQKGHLYQTRRQRVTLLALSWEQQTTQVFHCSMSINVQEYSPMSTASIDFGWQIHFSEYIDSQTQNLHITRINQILKDTHTHMHMHTLWKELRILSEFGPCWACVQPDQGHC